MRERGIQSQVEGRSGIGWTTIFDLGRPTLTSRMGRQIRLAFTATAALIIVVAAFYAVYVLHFEKEAKWRRLTHVADFVAETSHLELDHYRAALRMLSRSVAAAHGLQEGRATLPVTALLKSFRHSYPALSTVVVLGPHGHVWAESGTPLNGQLPWIRRRLPAGRSSGRPVFVVGHPHQINGIRGVPLWNVVYKAGKVEFAVAAIFPLASQQALWARLALPHDTVLGLLRLDDGMENRWPSTHPLMYQRKMTGALAQALRRYPLAYAGRYAGPTVPGSRYRLGVYRRLHGYPLVAFASLPVSAVFLGWWHLIQGPIALLCLVLAATYGVYRWTLRRQLRWEQERQQVDAQLFDAKERIEVTLRSIMEAVIATDTAGRIQYVNATAERVTGWAQAETQGRLLNEIFPCLDEYSGALLDPLACCLDGRPVGPEDALLFRRDGRSLPIERTAAPIRGYQGEITGVVLVFRDVTEKRVLTERLTHQATHDPLTQLPNRALYNSRLERAIAEAREHGTSVALLFLDLDGFKDINDSLGHDTGDRVLTLIAERLRRAVRVSDTLARLGGDEFAIVLPGLGRRSEVLPVVQKIMAAFDQVIVSLPEEIFLTASIGIAIYPDDSDDAQGLSRSADVAMYEAKASGKNTYRFFRSEMQDRARGRRSLEAHLHRALKHKEFHLVYQPQLRLATRQLAGVEVFLRWVHPTDGLKYPGEFLGIAEELGLTVPLGAWILQTAGAQSRHWRAQGLGCVPVAINMTGRQCRDEGLPGLLDQVLEDEKLRAEDIVIEIAEGLLEEDSELIIRRLHALKDRGVGLVIQNFGAGFSSLNHLKHVRADAIKIDFSFVAAIGEPSNEAIVLAVIALGRALGIRVEAGGVETASQYQFLKEAGCDVVQGTFISPPLAEEDAVEFFRSFAMPGS